MSKFDVKIGDIVHIQIGIGEVIAISKTKETFLITTDPNDIQTKTISRGVC